MATSVLYAGRNPFSGNSRAVINAVSEADEFIFYSQRWCDSQTIHLLGNLTGCMDFSGLIAAQNNLISNFSTDFKPLVITQTVPFTGSGLPWNLINTQWQSYNINWNAPFIGGGNIDAVVYSGDYCIIRGIDFAESPYVSICPFDVTINLFPQNLFSGVFGVLSPNEEWNYTESDDGIMGITHSISAVGFNSSQQAIQNAKDFVLSKSGISSYITPLLISNCNGNLPCLQSIEETFDRFNCSYSLVENYNLDLLNSGSGVVRYQTTLNSGFENGINEYSIDGSIDMCQGTSIGHIRNRYNQLNLFNFALTSYSGITNLTDLNPVPLSSGVVENITEKNLTFNVQFDNNSGPLVILDYTTNISYDRISEITSVSISAEIFGRGPLKNRYQNVLNYYNNNFNPYALANADYLAAVPNLVPVGYTLNPNPNSESQSLDQFAGKINYSATWTNKQTIPLPFQDWNYTINIIPSIRQYAAKPSLEQNGYYSIFDLNYANLEECSIQGDFQVLRSNTINGGVAAAQGIVNGLIQTYAPTSPKMLENNLTTGNSNGMNINFNTKLKGNAKYGNINTFPNSV